MTEANSEVWKTSFPSILKIDYAITKAFADKCNATLFGSEVPFARRLIQLKNGDIDLLCGLLKKEDREKYGYFLTPPYKLKSNKYFFVRKGEGHRLQKYEDLYSLQVGVRIGSKYFSRFDKDSKLDKFSAASDEGRFKMLVSNRVDAVIHTDVYGLYLLHNLRLQDKVEIAPYKYIKHNPVYMVISRKSKLFERKDDLEKVFQIMVKSGEIDQIIHAYFQNKDLPVPEYK